VEFTAYDGEMTKEEAVTSFT